MTVHASDPKSLRAAREQASVCKACPLWKNATQTVFGEGPTTSRVMLVGEQPGNEEDLTGKPFVGPAGKLLARALEDAGIERRRVYITNIVKHFKWEPRGKRRIHNKPNPGEVQACRPWLDLEVRLVAPSIVVCLGATAAQGILGRAFRVSKQRGEWIPSPLAPNVMATIHPSAILRERDDESRHEAMRGFVRDLTKVAARLASG